MIKKVHEVGYKTYTIHRWIANNFRWLRQRKVWYSREIRIILCFDGNNAEIIWAEIIDNTIVGPIRVPDGVRLTSKTYCDLLESVLLLWFENLHLLSRRKVILCTTTAKDTSSFLASLGIKGDSLMDWPACSPYLNPIENYWSILKQQKILRWTSIFLKGRAVKGPQGCSGFCSTWTNMKTDSINQRPTFRSNQARGGPTSALKKQTVLTR